MKVKLLFIATLVLLALNVNASPLMDIQNDVSNYYLRNDLQSDSWFNGHPNLKNLFTQKNGAKLLFAWIGEGNNEFFRKENSYSDKITAKKHFVEYHGLFIDRDRDELNLSIYVPHPKMANIVELGLSDVINDLMPPHVPIFFEKKIKIKGIDGKLYLHKDNACSIILPFPSNTTLRAYKKNCKDNTELETFTSGFDLVRLKQKLTKPEKNNNE